MTPEEHDLLRRSLDRLPIFPLPQGVLLPYEVLPLHVFEPRYRELMADLIEDGRPLAIAELAPGWEGAYEGRPAVDPVCGVGVVTTHERLPDGRYNLLLRGLARVRIDAELPPRRLYREVRARLLEDEISVSDAAISGRVESVRQMLLALASAKAGSAANNLTQLAARAETPGQLADIVAAGLLGDVERRRRALHVFDVAERLDLAQSAIAELLVLDPAGGPRALPN